MARRFLFAWRHALASEEGPRAPERHVALTLSLYMNGDGLGAWPSQKVLALRTSLTERTVRDALARLVAKKWLSREPRKSPKSGIKSKRWGYEYRARLPAELSNSYAKGERPSLFNGKDPRKPARKKNGEIHDQRKGNDVPTNTSGECVKFDAFRESINYNVDSSEIESYKTAFAGLS